MEFPDMWITYGGSTTNDPTTIATLGRTKTLYITAADCGRVFPEGKKYGGGVQRHGRRHTRDVEVKFFPFDKYAQPAFPDGQDWDDLEDLAQLFADFPYVWITFCNALDFTESSRITLPMQVVPVASLRAQQDDEHHNKKLTVRFEATNWL